MKLIPLGNRVLIKVDKPEEKSKHGFIIPDGAKDKPQMGVIVEVGPGKTSYTGDKVPIRLDKGVRVMFRPFIGDKVEANGEEFLILDVDSDILCVCEEKGEE